MSGFVLKVGDEVESEFGRGKVVAITKEWLIHENKSGDEVALTRDDDTFWIPVTDFEIGGGQDLQIDVADTDTF